MNSLLQSIELRNSGWLLLALQPGIVLLLAWLVRGIRQDAFADSHLLPWVRGQRHSSGHTHLLRHLLLFLAWGLLAIAMAGPRIAQQTLDRREDQFIELQIVVDLSRSMTANDVLPNRVQRGKLELLTLIDRLQDTRAGLIVFAGKAHVMLPATSDKNVLRHAINLLNTRQLPTEGSNLADALSLAAQQFSPQSQPRAILLISDGETHGNDNTELSTLVSELKQTATQLFVLGIGSREGAPILSDTTGWLQHDGRAVVTRLATERLQMLAQIGHGRYSEVTDDDEDWQRLYDEGIARLIAPVLNAQADESVIWQELSNWFLLPGLIMLILSYAQLAWPRTSHASALVLILSLIANGYPRPAAAEAGYAEAYQLYAQGEYRAAAQRFARLQGFEPQMAAGASHYQLQDYPQAAVHFMYATLAANDDQQRGRALFNLANAYFKQADYQQAEQLYLDTLRYLPDWRAAQLNLEYARVLQQQALEEPPVASREGTGIRSARVQDNVSINRGRISLDETSNPPDIDFDRNSALTDNKQASDPLQLSAPLTDKIQLDEDTSWTYDITEPQAIQQRHVQFKVDEALLWQRLYEYEEGFVAPLERPYNVPGTPPW